MPFWEQVVMTKGESEKSGVMVVGNVERAFSDVQVRGQFPFEHYDRVVDAIDAAGRNKYRLIGVVMSGTAANFVKALKSLRKVSQAARIVLLAEMWEEAEAVRLTRSGRNGSAMADEYLMCPTKISSLEGLPVYNGKPQAGEDKKVADFMDEQRITELEKLATTDELTGLKNRRYIWEFARQIIKRAQEMEERVTLLIFDIDDFKHYNDLYGHSAGDQILKQAAVLIQRCCRAHDVVGRIGGDEFAVIFWQHPSRSPGDAERRSASAEPPKEAIFIAKRFRSELSKAEFDLLGPEGKGVLSISGGLAGFPRDARNISELVEQADSALLQAKRSGKNRIYLVGTPQADIENM